MNIIYLMKLGKVKYVSKKSYVPIFLYYWMTFESCHEKLAFLISR